MSKARIDTHLSEDASEAIIRKLLPQEWVIRKLHPDYGVDVTIEVFERVSTRIPTMGEFLFVQLKSTENIQEATIKIRRRGNVEKAKDAQQGQYVYELDTIKHVIDADTIDNAKLMGPSTPLMLFVVDIDGAEVYYICLTDYYDKILEPQGFDFSQQNSVTIHIPKSSRLSSPQSLDVMRFYAARAKLYGMFNLAQFQFRESRYLLNDLANHEEFADLEQNFRIIERFARRLRAMPVWERPTIWVLIRDYKDRLDRILSEIDSGALEKIQAGIKAFLAGDADGLIPLMQFTQLCALSWEQFSAIGQAFEDLVREWFLPTFVGQLGSGEDRTCRDLAEPHI